jgi:hypothetical protein
MTSAVVVSPASVAVYASIRRDRPSGTTVGVGVYGSCPGLFGHAGRCAAFRLPGEIPSVSRGVLWGLVYAVHSFPLDAPLDFVFSHPDIVSTTVYSVSKSQQSPSSPMMLTCGLCCWKYWPSARRRLLSRTPASGPAWSSGWRIGSLVLQSSLGTPRRPRSKSHRLQSKSHHLRCWRIRSHQLSSSPPSRRPLSLWLPRPLNGPLSPCQ